MNIDRPVVLAVSNSAQYIETLQVLLDADFQVAMLHRLDAAPTGGPQPAVVVLAPTVWEDRLPAAARSLWPESSLVMIDAPAPMRAAFPHATVASWSDPFSLRDVVASGVDFRRNFDRPARAVSPANVLRFLDEEIGRPIRISLTLAQLCENARSSASSGVALRMFGERILALLDELDWVTLAESGPGAAATQADLGTALWEAIEARRLRCFCRGLFTEWHREAPFLISCPPSMVRAIARCLSAYLLRMCPPGTITIGVEPTLLTCSHPGLPRRPRPGALTILNRLLAAVGARLLVRTGCITVGKLFN